MPRHLFAVQQWAESHEATAHLSTRTCALMVNRHGRTAHLAPRFVKTQGDGLAYTRQWEWDSGFTGWVLPDAPSWPQAQDKIIFKRLCIEQGVRVPAGWNSGPALASDFICKNQRGSFGAGIEGPFSAVSSPELTQPGDYFEAFIVGKSAKAWCWNAEIFALEVLEPPYLLGNGVTALSVLAQSVRWSADSCIDLKAASPYLAWQGFTPESVAAAGEKVYLSFKYADSYQKMQGQHVDVWASTQNQVKDQFAQGAAKLFAALPQAVSGSRRLLYTLDAVIDQDQQVWFLEMNSHPMSHPTLYAPMLSSLLGPIL